VREVGDQRSGIPTQVTVPGAISQWNPKPGQSG
jgi:hypothetical protein